MHKKYLQTLEYPKILAQLARYTTFSASKALALNLQPTPFWVEAQTLQTETTEARHLLSAQPDVSVAGAVDARPLLEQARRGIIITPQDFLSLARTLTIARDLRRKITRLETQYPHLADIAYRLEEIIGLVNRINQCFDDAGNVKDSASAELGRIRREIDVTHGRLQE